MDENNRQYMNQQYMNQQDMIQQDMNQQYMQNDANVQSNSNVQNNANVQDDLDKPENEWKFAIGIGIVGVILSILCGSFRIRVISAWLIILLLAGVYCSFTAIQGGIKTRKAISLLMGIIAMVINLAATLYYGWSMIYTIISKFN